MDVILLEKVRNLGNLSDQVKVKPGYGRNYLIPYGKAAVATEANIAMLQERHAELEQKAADTLQSATNRAEAIAKLNVVIKANASEEGKLYGSIGPLEIARAITEAGQTVAKKEVMMPQGAIHTVGNFAIELQLHSDVVTSVQLEIVAA